MTELEQKLSDAFTLLSTEFAQRAKDLEAQNRVLSQHVQTLAGQVQRLSSQLEQQSSDAANADKKLREDLNKAFGILGKRLADLAES